MVSRVQRWFSRASAARLLVLGFAGVILIGAFLLWLPISHNPGYSLSFLDALFESGSAVCVTGLTTVVVGEVFSLFGKIVLAILIQIGGMGVVLMGMFFLMMAGGKMSFKVRSLFVQAQNLTGYSHTSSVAQRILAITFSIEAGGAVLLSLLLMRYYPFWQAVGHGVFLSISAFNNAGFDLFPEGESLIPFAADVPFNLVISALVIIGGFGFIALMDLFFNKFRWKKLLLTTKIGIVMCAGLLISGTVLLKLTTDQTWLQAWLQSVIARTAGFATYPMAAFSQAGMLIFIMLMFIGANPNSTGGGVKTTTVFVAALKAISSSTAHDEDSVFYRKVPALVFDKAYAVLFFGAATVLTATVLLCVLEPKASLGAVMVEVVSAVGTVGSSCGLTPSLSAASKVIIIICMFIGRLGPVTVANVLVRKNEKQAVFTEENVLIG